MWRAKTEGGLQTSIFEMNTGHPAPALRAWSLDHMCYWLLAVSTLPAGAESGAYIYQMKSCHLQMIIAGLALLREGGDGEIREVVRLFVLDNRVIGGHGVPS